MKIGTMAHRMGTFGFSLVELLVVIAVVAVLTAVLLPGLRQAREQALKVRCQSNERQLIVASHAYAQDYKGFAPDPGFTGAHAFSVETRKVLFDQYALGNPTLWWCPTILDRGIANYKTVRVSMNPKWFNDPAYEPVEWDSNHRSVTGYDYFMGQLRGWVPTSPLAATYQMPRIDRFGDSNSPSTRIVWGEPLAAPGQSGWSSNWSAPLNGHDTAGNFIATGANYAMVDGHVEWRSSRWGMNTVATNTSQYFIYTP